LSAASSAPSTCSFQTITPLPWSSIHRFFPVRQSRSRNSGDAFCRPAFSQTNP